jgi:hypothetical protein
MKFSVLILVPSFLLFTACSITKPHEKTLAKEAEPLGLQVVQKSILDSVFVAKDTTLKNY